jgi:hypothetical protein
MMTLDFVSKYRDMMLNIGELTANTKQPKTVNGKVPYHNEINVTAIDVKDGLCVYCGVTSNNLMIIDLDNPELFKHFESYKDKTMIVQSGKKGYHIYFRTFENPKSRSLTNAVGQHIDILGQGKIGVLPPSIHVDTKNRYEIISDKPIKQLTRIEEQGIYQKLNDLGFGINEKKSVKELHSKDFTKSEGQNRGEDLLRVIASWKIKNPELTENILFLMAKEYNNEHFEPPYLDEKVSALVKQALNFGEQKIIENKIEESSEVDDGKTFQNKQWSLVSNEIQNKHHFVTLRETKEMWYYNEKEGVYFPNADTIIEEECQRLVNCCTTKTRTEVKNTIKANRTMINSKDLFESTHIHTENCVLNPKTFKLSEHSYKYLTTTKLPFAVNFNARNLKLWNHILTIIDVKDINLIMELIWICISWNNPFKKCFVFKGIPNTQKTTLSDIIVWMIGESNVSREKPQQFLAKDTRFSTSKFIGRRMNTASEIGNLTEPMIENQKSLIGAEKQNTEKKGDNTERYFDPTKFVFLYTTNTLGKIYSSINDNSIITRFQFLIFRNAIDENEANGLWYDDFFDSDEDKQSAIETIINIVIHYKQAQSLGIIPRTKWSNVADTKKILDEEMPIEDKFFKEERVYSKEGGKITINEIKKDFESYVNYKITNQEMGNILKKHGYKSTQSNGITVYRGLTLSSIDNQNQETIQ